MANNFLDHVEAIKDWVRQVGPTRAARMAGLAIGTVKIAVSERGNPTAATLEALDAARNDHLKVMSSRPSRAGVSPQT